MGAGASLCSETLNLDGTYYVFDTMNYGYGPLVVLDTEEYQNRIERVQLTDDANEMFDPEDRNNTSLKEPDLRALKMYARKGMLDAGAIPNRESVIAYADIRTLGGISLTKYVSPANRAERIAA